jgi:predicted alpha/beta hydrolase family esterase
VHYLMVPGIDGSDDFHWQSIWERRRRPRASRITPASWSRPDLKDWTSAIDDAVRQTDDDVVIVAHSLGCLAAINWLNQRPNAIRGAFLVAPPDTAGPRFPAQAAAMFVSVRPQPLPVPGLIVSSDDDPYCSAAATALLAHDMEIPHISVGHGGHLNSASGLGEWHTGRSLLVAFAAGAARPSGGGD